MSEQLPQKDAMDVLQAFVDDYNARARPAIPLGSAGEAGGAQLRLRYSPAEGTSFDLGTLGGSASEALAVNQHGQVVGHSHVARAKHAFVIPEPGRMLDLGSLGGATSIAHDVNDRGDVVGLAETSTGRPHAFFWTAADGMRDLGALGAAPSIA